MGGGTFPGTTNVPHLNILQDNGKADGQRIYFNQNTLSLSYCRGTDNAPITDHSVTSWKQMHVATVHAITVTNEDRAKYKFFAKNIREEIRDVADSMIEAAYMDLRLTALSGVKNITTSLGFQKLRGSLCARATDLLLELENNKREEANEYLDDYKALFKELKELYDYKYMVKADDLAKEFMEQNNITVRQPLNHKKRFTNFITVIFRSKLTAQHKNSFLPMFTRYLAVKDGDENEAERVELKCPAGDKKGYDFVF